MRCARSQLELYLDDWEQSSLRHDANAVGGADHSIVSPDPKPVASCCSAVQIAYVVCHSVEWVVGRVVCIVLRAVLSDTLHIANQSRLHSVSSRSNEATETKSLCMALVTSCDDSPWQRCCIMCVLLLYYCYYLAHGTLERGMSSIVYRYCHQSLWAMMFLYLLTPMLMGTLINAQRQRMLAKSTSCVTMASHLLSSIKRLQLVNMGGVICQPSPPIAQLESKLLSTMAGEGGNSSCSSRGILSCRAVRRGLHAALNVLTEQTLRCSRDMQIAVIDVNRSLQQSNTIDDAELTMGIDAPDVSLLLHLLQWPVVDGTGARDTDTPSLVELQHSVEVALDIYLSVLPSKLALMLSRCYSLCDCGHADPYGDGIHRYSYAVPERPLSKIYWRMALLISILSLLLRMPFYMHSMIKIMDNFEHDCCELGKLFAINRSGGQYDDDGGIVSTEGKSRCYHGHDYINLRKKLSCIRRAFDTISHRIWLAEEVLCDPSVVKYWLLSDHRGLMSGRDDEEHQRSLQVLCDAMSKLSGSMREEGSTAAGDASMHLESVELQLNSLPAIVDYKELFSQVELLQQAIEQCRRCPSENSGKLSNQPSPRHHGPVVMHGDDLAAVTSSSSSSTIGRADALSLLGSDVLCPTDDDFGTTTTTGSMSSYAGVAADGGVLDIYVTTIPSQTDRLAIGDRSEIATTNANTRSDASQRLFMTELRNRLHRCIVPCVPPNSDNCSMDRNGGASSATAPSNDADADDDADDLHRTSPFPTRYRLERVTELRLSDRGDASEALEVRRVTTDVTRASSVALPNDALPGASCGSSSRLRRHDDSYDMVRIGSMMVPRDQSEQYAYQATTTSSTGLRSALSESMTREITSGGSNLFADALSARREAEVIAGDVDVDADVDHS